MAQSIGYTLCAFGPLLVGLLHDATGSWTAPLVLLLALLGPQVVCGALAGRNRTVRRVIRPRETACSAGCGGGAGRGGRCRAGGRAAGPAAGPTATARCPGPARRRGTRPSPTTPTRPPRRAPAPGRPRGGRRRRGTARSPPRRRRRRGRRTRAAAASHRGLPRPARRAAGGARRPPCPRPAPDDRSRCPSTPAGTPACRRPARHQQPTCGVEAVAGEREVAGRGRAVHGRLVRDTGGPARVVEEHHLLADGSSRRGLVVTAVLSANVTGPASGPQGAQAGGVAVQRLRGRTPWRAERTGSGRRHAAENQSQSSPEAWSCRRHGRHQRHGHHRRAVATAPARDGVARVGLPLGGSSSDDQCAHDAPHDPERRRARPHPTRGDPYTRPGPLPVPARPGVPRPARTRRPSRTGTASTADRPAPARDAGRHEPRGAGPARGAGRHEPRGAGRHAARRRDPAPGAERRSYARGRARRHTRRPAARPHPPAAEPVPGANRRPSRPAPSGPPTRRWPSRPARRGSGPAARHLPLGTVARRRGGYRCAVPRCRAAVLWPRAAGARCHRACRELRLGDLRRRSLRRSDRRRTVRNGWRRGRDRQRRTGSFERLVRHRPAARAEDDGHGRTAREQPCRCGTDPRVPEPRPNVLRTEQVPDRPLRRPHPATMRRHLTSPRVDRRRSCVVRLSRGVTITSTRRCGIPTLTRRRDDHTRRTAKSVSAGK